MSVSPKDPAFEEVLKYLRETRGFDFAAYKRSSLMRRASKRMHEVKATDFEDYRDYLEVHPDEFTLLFNTILINVTSFLRDPSAWQYLKETVVPEILAGPTAAKGIRVWSAGCASGEEAYTLAMVLAEAMGDSAFRDQVKIYATDVDEEALATARHAAYSAKALEPLPPEWREKYFEHGGDQFLFRSDVRRSVIFGRHDLLQNAPISQLDLLVCRNCLMYLNAEAQAQILSRFHFGLRDNGFLFLGKAEMLLAHAGLFQPKALEHRIFSKVSGGRLLERVPLAGEGAMGPMPTPAAYVPLLLRDRAFQAGPAAQIVLDEAGSLVVANDLARRTFNLLPRNMKRPFQDLELSYRPVELRSLIERALKERRVVSVEEVEHRTDDQAAQFFDVQVVPLEDESGKPMGITIVFQDVTHPHRLQQDLQRVNHDLETASEELQSANEELETTNEELQSTVEELQTTNEELQSTNEEMETMNEELQSTNTELETANRELQARSGERDRLNDFLQSILSSVRVGVVVVDENMNVLLWNDEAQEMWGLRTEEVMGRPLKALDIGLPVDDLATQVQRFLAGDDSQARIVHEAVNRRGRAVRCRVTCTLRLEQAGGRPGVVLLMEEGTA